MKVSTIHKAYIELFSDFAQKTGLHLSKSSGDLTLKRPEFTARFVLLKTVYDDIWLYPVLFIEYKSLARLAKVFFPNRPHFLDAVRINLFTLRDFLLEKYDGRRSNNRYFTIRSEEDIASFGKAYLELVQMALSYIDGHCSSIAELNTMYNSIPYWKENPHCSWYYDNCFLGPAVAKLSNNSNYESLRDIYVEIIENGDVMPDHEMKDAFYKMIAILDSM